VDIAAPVDAVSRLVCAFDLVADFHPQIASCQVDGEGAGATRVLFLADGQEIHERLIEERAQSYRYEGIRESRHFQSWRGRIEVVAEGAGSRVTWSIEFEPTPGTDARAAGAQQAGIFEEGLASAQRQLAGLD